MEGFNSLSKLEQDVYLWELASPSSPGFLGKGRMCAWAENSILGCSHRLQKFRRCRNLRMIMPPSDLREKTNLPGKKLGKMAADCNVFMTWVYWSIAEVLPDLSPCDRKKFDVDVGTTSTENRRDCNGILKMYQCELEDAVAVETRTLFVTRHGPCARTPDSR